MKSKAPSIEGAAERTPQAAAPSGSDTLSSSEVKTFVYHMIRHPDVWDHLRKEIDGVGLTDGWRDSAVWGPDEAVEAGALDREGYSYDGKSVPPAKFGQYKVVSVYYPSKPVLLRRPQVLQGSHRFNYHTMHRFTLFTSLPPELQVMIWHEAILNELPTAYHFELMNSEASDESKALKHIKEPGCEKHATSAFSKWFVTCEISSYEAEKVLKGLRPLFVTPMKFQGLPYCIDAHTDLCILKDYWEEPWTYRHVGGVSQIRYVGVKWPGPRSLLKRSERSAQDNAERLLNLFPKLDALYVVVHPNHTNSENCTLKNADTTACQKVVRAYQAFLKNYISATGQRPPLRFHCGSREYYDLPAGNIAHIKGLEQVSPFLEAAMDMISKRDVARKKVACLVMSWRGCERVDATQ
ncbi:hypothetical protein PG984_004064 [Apiospora sp. TS-2023a]